MKFEFSQNANLPPLAWLCCLEKNSQVAKVEVGDGVKTSSSFFFEGAWAGDFDQAQFLENPCFGTGARIDESAILFTGPDHLLDRLFFMREGNALYLSNSLAFLLKRLDKKLCMDRADYAVLYGNIRHGLSNYHLSLPLADGAEVEMWSWFHLRVSSDLEITCQDKARAVSLPNFKAYADFLSATIDSVFKNAADPNRRLNFEPLSTISSGYDSTMVSVLAKQHGCNEAITFAKSRSRPGRSAEDDSGREAANVLGLTVIDLDRLGYRKQSGFPETESLGAGSELSSARDHIAGKVLLTGYMGDTMWDRQPKTVSDDIQWPLIAGHNHSELRLSTASVHFCVPFLAVRQQQDIIAISQSEEMAPWRLDNDYDRPICRRICEENGIPRESFGIKKRAAGVFFREEGLRETMTPQSYEDYTAFRLAHSNVSSARARTFDRLVKLGRISNAVIVKLTRLAAKMTRTKPRPFQIPVNPGLNSESALIFQWAVDRLGERYGECAADGSKEVAALEPEYPEAEFQATALVN